VPELRPVPEGVHSRFLLKIYAGISQGVDRCRVTTADTPRCRDFFQHFMELSSGTFRLQVDHILAEGDVVVVLCTDSARRGDRSWSSPQVHVWTGIDIEPQPLGESTQLADVVPRLASGSLIPITRVE